MAERVYVEISDGRKGWYTVTEAHPDGAIVVAPDRSKEAGQQADSSKGGDAQPLNPPPRED